MIRVRAHGLEHLAEPVGTGGGVRLECDWTLVYPDNRAARPCAVCFPAKRLTRTG